MATKNLARTVVEGGRDTYSKLGSVVGGLWGRQAASLGLPSRSPRIELHIVPIVYRSGAPTSTPRAACAPGSPWAASRSNQVRPHPLTRVGCPAAAPARPAAERHSGVSGRLAPRQVVRPHHLRRDAAATADLARAVLRPGASKTQHAWGRRRLIETTRARSRVGLAAARGLWCRRQA